MFQNILFLATKKIKMTTLVYICIIILLKYPWDKKNIINIVCVCTSVADIYN